MKQLAKNPKELGKLDELTEEEAEEMIRNYCQWALLKYFILKVDPKKI